MQQNVHNNFPPGTPLKLVNATREWWRLNGEPDDDSPFSKGKLSKGQATSPEAEHAGSLVMNFAKRLWAVLPKVSACSSWDR